MSSKRNLRRKKCEGKKPYELAKATFMRHLLERKLDGGWSEYKCSFCGKWHIGHIKRNDYGRRLGAKHVREEAWRT